MQIAQANIHAHLCSLENVFTFCKPNLWTLQNLIWKQQRLRPDCTNLQSGLSLCCLHTKWYGDTDFSHENDVITSAFACSLAITMLQTSSPSSSSRSLDLIDSWSGDNFKLFLYNSLYFLYFVLKKCPQISNIYLYYIGAVPSKNIF